MILVVLSAFSLALGQQGPTTKAPPPDASSAAAPARLGVFFWHDSPNDEAAWQGIRSGLQSAGLPCEFVVRRADGDRNKAETSLRELGDAGCRLLFAMGTQAALLAQQVLPRTPCVFVAVANPVASGVVPSWDGASAAIAGASYWIEPATILRVFRQALPDLRRLGMLHSNASGIVSRAELQAMQECVRDGDGGEVAVFDECAKDATDIPRAVEALLAKGCEALWIPNDFVIYQNLDLVQHKALPLGVPLVATALSAARTQAIVGVTVDFEMHGKRAAALALQILDGAAPQRLRVDRMQGFRIIANLDAARRCGRSLPLSLLAVADELIAEEDDDRSR